MIFTWKWSSIWLIILPTNVHMFFTIKRKFISKDWAKPIVKDYGNAAYGTTFSKYSGVTLVYYSWSALNTIKLGFTAAAAPQVFQDKQDKKSFLGKKMK